MSEAVHQQLAGSVDIFDTPDAVAAEAAGRIVELAGAARQRHGTFRIALTGGETPKPLYARLSAEPLRSRVDWSSWRIYFGDERGVAPDDAGSNYRLVRECLLDHVPVAAQHVYRMRGESEDLDEAAREYAEILERNLPQAANGAPRLDFVLLGLGENGHTASLFPGTWALDVTDRWVVRSRADYAPFDRITMTFPTLNAGAIVMFLVTGEKKARALRSVAGGTAPASRVRPIDGSLLWLLDRAAAEG